MTPGGTALLGIALPLVLALSWLAARGSARAACAAAPWLALLVVGLYLMVCFRPVLLVLGVPLAVAALVLAGGARELPSPRAAGFGVSGFGALGCERWETYAWR
jgi:hypothetical protein